jgi:hypothetical protein
MIPMSTAACHTVLCHIARRIPVLSYAIRCMEEERFDELATLGLVVAMAVVLAILIWGVPALILALYAAVGTAALLILSATRG